MNVSSFIIILTNSKYMKKSLIINLILMTFVMTSCHNSEKYENTSLFSFSDFKTTEMLNATQIEFDEPIMLPLLFVKSDSLLIIQNLKSINMLYVYNVNSRKKVGEFISWGSGPDDFLAIKNLQLVGSDLYISDIQKRAIVKYDINDFHKLSKNLMPIQKIEIEDFFSNLVYTDNGYVATTMNSDKNRLIFFDSKGEKMFTAGDYPYFGKELTAIEKIEGYVSQIAISHKYERIFLFGMVTDLIEIYDFQGNLIKRFHGPEQIFPQIKEMHLPNGYSQGAYDNPTFTFFTPMIIDDEIYVSYSGNHQKPDDTVPYIRQIFVFDIDCTPRRRYELSEPIVSFTVDPVTKNIYATSNDPEYHMVIFQIQRIVR